MVVGALLLGDDKNNVTVDKVLGCFSVYASTLKYWLRLSGLHDNYYKGRNFSNRKLLRNKLLQNLFLRFWP